MDRELTAREVGELRLPIGGCCCTTHEHRWYERADHDEVWLECYHCGEQRDA